MCRHDSDHFHFCGLLATPAAASLTLSLARTLHSFAMKTLFHATPLAVVALCVFSMALTTQVAMATRSGVACRLLSNPVQMASRLCLCRPCHLCEFSFWSGGCGLIKVKGVSLSDGSDVAFEHPLLKPEQWFLTQDAITQSRGGVARDGLAAASAGNKVTAFVATREFFDAVFDDLEATRAKDRILLTAWSTDNVPLKPESDPSGAASGFQGVISRAVARGVNFHALVWNNLLEKDQNVRMRNFVNALSKNATSRSSNGIGKAEFIFDDRLPTPASAHHQKTLVIQRESGEVVVAYVGGIDITGDRWDTIKHDQDALRKKAGIDRGRAGWLDAHVRIDGPAAKDVAANFVARWNSKTKPSQDLLDDLLDFENPVYSTLPVLVGVKNSERAVALVEESSEDEIDEGLSESFDEVIDFEDDDSDSSNSSDDATASEVDDSSEVDSVTDLSVEQATAAANKGPHNVQIVRTFSCKYKNYDFAPKGETSLFQARIHAIRIAKNYVYIEDQYFVFVPELLDELLMVLPQLQRVIIVAPWPGTEVKVAGYEKLLFDMVSPLQQRFPNKVQLYATKLSRNLYIHTKLVIVDDVFLSIGSANWNRRSMTSDSEIGANIVDDEQVVATADGVTVNKLAFDYRLRKFSEHTGRSYDDLKKMKFLDAANEFDTAAKDAGSIIEALEVDEKAYFVAYTSDAVRNLIDPRDVC
ncbi:hypothetical protein PybrP1_004818 [[Pythium] brassicae (nom. inval.)]|nr:hypothetical protein PybrP1_004818 [[Pythium] brassicae (nom. inval.)]